MFHNSFQDLEELKRIMVMAGNFYTMTPYTSWAMPKIEWDLIYKAGAIQQARGDKAEQKYSDFTTLYDNLKLHEKYNESYQNWRAETDKELDNLINNHGGKLGTVGFNRELDRLIGSKKNDPWIKNAIQSSEQAKLYEENILRNPDIKPYNDPNSEEYLGWLEDKSPSFKYKGFYKDAPVEKWFEAKAKEFPANKWTEFSNVGKYTMETTQHDQKTTADIQARFDELKNQFSKTPEGQQMQRMIDAGVYGDLTYDEVFSSYVSATAKSFEYDNETKTRAKNIEQEAEFERQKYQEEKALKERQLNQQQQQINQQGAYQRRMAAVAERGAAVNEAELKAQIESGYFNRSSSAGSNGYTDAGIDEFVMPIINAARADTEKFNSWKNGQVGAEYKTKISSFTGGSSKAKSAIEENIKNGDTALSTSTGKQISITTVNSFLELIKSGNKIEATNDLTLKRTENGAEVYISATTPLLSKQDMEDLIEDYNDKNKQKLTVDDFEKVTSGDYVLKLQGKDPAVTGYFKQISPYQTLIINGKNTENPLYVPPVQLQTTPPPITNNSYTAPQQTGQAPVDSTGTTMSADTAAAVAATGISTNQVAVSTGDEKIDLQLKHSGFVVEYLDKDDFFSLTTKFNKPTGNGELEAALHYNKVKNKFDEPVIFVGDSETNKTIGAVYTNVINLGKFQVGSDDKHRVLTNIRLDRNIEFSKLLGKLTAINDNISAGYFENKSGQRIEIQLPSNGVGILEPNTRAVIAFEKSANGQENYGVYPVPGRSLMESTKSAETKRQAVKNFAYLLEALSNNIN